MAKIVEVKPITENLPQYIQEAVVRFNTAASQEPRKGLSIPSMPDLNISLASESASNNVPNLGAATVREV